MKIIFPVVGFSKSGGYRVLSKLADEFIACGHEVVFVSPCYGGRPYYPTNAKIISVKSYFDKIRVLRVLFGILAVFINILKNKKGVVIANHNITSYIVHFLPARFKKYYYVQAYEVKLVSGFAHKLVAYLSYLLPIKKIVNSENILPGRITKIVGVVPAGVEVNLFRDCGVLYDKTKKIKIGFVGRVEKYKGSNEIISAFSELVDKYDLILNVAVHLPFVPENIAKKTNYFPINNDSELADFYKENDIIVATGLIEDGAFHYPCAEAMASSRVVISNYSPLVLDRIIINPGLQLKNVDSLKIVKALEYAINMDQKAQRAEVEKNQTTISSYSWDIIGSKFLELIDD